MQKKSIFSLGGVSWGHFLSHFYLMVLPPIFPFLLEKYPFLTNTNLGLLVSMLAFSRLLFQFPVGILVDKIGAKPVLFTGLLLASGGILLLGLAPNYMFLLIFSFLIGIGQSTIHPADYAIMSALTNVSQEGKVFGVHSFVGMLGWAFAPIALTLLDIQVGLNTGLLLIGSLGIISSFTIYPLLPSPPEHAVKDKEESTLSLSQLLHGSLLLLFLYITLIAMANSGIRTFTTLFLSKGLHFTVKQANSTLSAFFFATAVGTLMGGVLADHYSSKLLTIFLMTATATISGLILLVALRLTIYTVLLLFGCLGIAFGSASPARDRLVSAISSKNSTGQTFGLAHIGLPLGGMIAPSLLGVIMDLQNIFRGYLLIPLFLICTIPILIPLSTEE